MKKLNLLFTIAAVALLYIGCKKDSNATNKPVSIGTTASDSYFPVTVGSAWEYRDGLLYNNILITDTTTVFDGRRYQNAIDITQSTSKFAEEYFYAADHLFATKFTTVEYGKFDLQVLNDTMAVGHSWVGPLAYEALISTIPATTTTTIKEKGISLTVSGVTFTNVIHTQADIQYYINGSYQEYGKYDFYFAKGVGIIKSVFNLSGETREIMSYNIK